MKKRLLAALMAGAMALSMAACGNSNTDSTTQDTGSGDDAAIALADGMKADWLWVTKGLEQEISAVSLDAGKGRIFFTAAGAAKGNAVSSRLRMPRGRSCGAGISGSRRNLGW